MAYNEQPWLRGKNKKKADEVADLFAQIMGVLDLDLEDPHFKETPQRVGRMFLEIFRGLDKKAQPSITTFPNSDNYSQMVMVKDIEFYSVCAHHMIPFFGRAHVAYIPDEKLVGLSKIPRIVEMYARRPQLQERLTEDVINFLESNLEPIGSIVVVEARHLCMEMRGVEKPGAYTTTSAIRGSFTDKMVREEFLDLLSKDSNHR